MRAILFYLIVVQCIGVGAQNDTISHSAKKATILSACLPGSGQIYNKQFWKAPVVYVAGGTLGYLMVTNQQGFKKYKEAWIFRTDNDPNTIDAFPQYTADNLNYLFNTYRRWRDLSGIGMIVLYSLNVIDANVYGHLYNFDVDNISMNVRPSLIVNPNGQLVNSLSISMRF